MLHRLSVRNYAIIDKLEIEFCDRMNIITGETGAGKSILIGALGLILGERADTKVLYNKEEKCVVEADFEIENKNLKMFFSQNELDFDTHTIVRREINQNGKSRAFINDTPVTLNILQELGESLVNLHTQHETLDLVTAGFQLNIIDTLAKNQTHLSNYSSLFAQYKNDGKRLDELNRQYQVLSAELDYLQFQVKELSEAKLKGDELEALEMEISTLGHVEEIKRALQNAIQLLSDDEVCVLSRLGEVQSQLKSVKNFNKDILALGERLQTSLEELKDISHELGSIQDSTSLDPERLEEVNGRLNTVYRLQKKHNASTIADLLKIQNELEERIFLVDTNSSEIEGLKAQMDKNRKNLISMADQLHRSREQMLRGFQNNMVVLLTKVGMPNSAFKVEITKLSPDLLNENGLTEIRFLFSANKGFAPQEIKEVASGGELSRLMLSIKSLVADSGALPTMIFDEIDAGISGEVALKVGEIMKKLTRNHQIISITHLPQIARAGDAHFFIYKETKDNRTYTRIKELKGEERVIEIAKMLSGDKVSDASLANARELIAH